MKIETKRDELARLRKIERLLRAMFAKAKREQLFVGLGRKAGVADIQQEGPKVKRMRKLLGIRRPYDNW